MCFFVLRVVIFLKFAIAFFLGGDCLFIPASGDGRVGLKIDQKLRASKSVTNCWESAPERESGRRIGPKSDLAHFV